MNNSKATILVIDDDDMIREIFQAGLESYGYTVITAENGKVGLDMLSKNKIDLAVIDIIMPEKEGIETIIETRNIYPDLKIISISGGGKLDPQTYLEMSQHLGAFSTLSKPIHISELLAAIEEALES